MDVVLQPGPKINIVMMKTTTLTVTGMVELVVTIINIELIIIAKLVNALKALLVNNSLVHFLETFV